MPNKKRLSFDLHVHSNYSYDSHMVFRRMVPYIRLQNLAGLAITDHESFQFHEKERFTGRFQIIKGMETKTEYGDVVGLFLQQRLRSRAFLEVCNEIKEQGGLVMMPHPFRDNNIMKLPSSLLSRLDLVEIYNGRYDAKEPAKDRTRWIKRMAVEHKITLVAASDAHNYHEIGRARISTTEKDLKKALIEGDVRYHLIPQMLFLPIYMRLFGVFRESLRSGQVKFFFFRLREFLDRL
jgi:predicted metal-dependent phosphoesterase TrpH